MIFRFEIRFLFVAFFNLAATLTSIASEEIDVLVLYTNNVETYYGGSSGTEAHILSSIGSANMGLGNSSINVRLNLVGMEKIEYVEDSEDMENDLDHITLKDGVADEVLELRNRYGADLVCLFRDSSDPDTSGVAWILNNKSGSPDYGFSVVEARSAISGYVFLHEIGHNLGGAHDRDNSDNGGLYPYSYGNRFQSSGTEYRTVMAYYPGFEINFISNPAVSYLGTPTGVSETQSNSANNAKTFGLSAPTVASYRVHKPVLAAYRGKTVFTHGLDSIVLDGSGSTADEGIASWQWSWNGGSANGVSPEVLLPVGETLVTLTVKDVLGQEDSIVIAINVLVLAGALEVESSEIGNFIIDVNGGLWGRGYNGARQLGTADSGFVSDYTKVIASGVKSVSTSNTHTLILKDDGSVMSVGDNFWGQLGDGTRTYRSLPVEIMSSGARSVFAGSRGSFIVKTDGSLYAFGNNEFNSLSLGDAEFRNVPSKVLSSGVKSAYAGHTGSFVVKDDGSLWKIGRFPEGEFSQFELVFESGARSCSVAENTFMIVKDDGSLWGAGFAYYRQLGYTPPSPESPLVEIHSSDVVASYSSEKTSYFVKTDGSLWGLGNNDSGELGKQPYDVIYMPTKILPSRVIDVAPSRNSLVVVRDDGSHWSLGENEFKQFGQGPSYEIFPLTKTRPAFIEGLNSKPTGLLTGLTYEDFDSTGAESIVLDASVSRDDWLVTKWNWEIGEETFEGKTIEAELPVGVTPVKLTVTDDEGAVSTATLNVEVLPPTPVDKISAGKGFSLVLKSSGLLLASGVNSSGQLGDGTGFTSLGFVTTFSTGVKDISSNLFNGYALTEQGALYGFGYNGVNQLGRTGSSSELSPVLIVPEGVVQVSSGSGYVVFLREDGTLWGLGNGSSGVLGNDQIIQPTPIKIDSNVKKISAGESHLLILKEDGSLWGIGDNSYGQIGDVGLFSEKKPTLIVDSGIKDMSAGYRHTLLLKEDGSAWGFGSNSYGELGLSYFFQTWPTPFRMIESGVSQVVAGYRKSFFIMQDGSLWIIEDTEFRKMVFSGVESVANSETHTLIKMLDGSLLILGKNHFEAISVFESMPKAIISNGTKVFTIKDWLLEYFTEEQIAEIRTSLDKHDTDGDGLSNGVEEMLGLNPNDRDSNLSMNIFHEDGEQFVEISPFSPRVAYYIMRSANLRGWSRWQDFERNVEGDRLRVKISGEGSLFIRVDVGEALVISQDVY